MSAVEEQTHAVSAGTSRLAVVTGPARWLNQRAHLGSGGRVGLAILAVVVGACLFVPLLLPYGPQQIVALPYQAPSVAHPFGTDQVGRDLLVRVLAGGRLDFLIAFVTVGVSMALGAVIGVLAGSAKHQWVDSVLMRIVDAVIAFPFLILVLVLIVALGPERSLGPLPAGAPAVMIGMILGNWAFYARIARGQTLTLRDRDYVVAARVLGLSRARITLRHLLPGTLGIVAAYAVGDVILTMITVASLSFVGVGVQPPAPEWGAIMSDGQTALQSAWWIAVIPGIILALTGLGLSLLADAALRLRGERG
jgi:peptide/nickel transport system permease protein